jgi:hypothetical protein
MGSLVVLLLAEQRGGWSLMIFCARATRGRGLPSLDARSGRSISPHPREITSELGGSIYIIRRAHSRINQATLENEVGDWEDTRSWGLILDGLFQLPVGSVIPSTRRTKDSRPLLFQPEGKKRASGHFL